MILQPGSTPWLLVHELRLARRALTSRKGMRWQAPLLLAVFLINGLVVGVPAGLAIRRLGFTPTPMIVGVLDLIVVGIFTLMLSQSLAGATETLYGRGDLDLLFSSPVAPRRVLFAKCAGIAANAFLGFALLATPLILPVALLARPAWLSAYAVLAALALLAAATGLVLSIALFRIVGAKRARTVSQLLAVLIGASMFLVAQSRNLLGRQTFDGWVSVASRHAGDVMNGPLAWPLAALQGRLDVLTALIVATIAVFTGATLWIGRRFASDTAAASGAAAPRASASRGETAFAGGVFRVTFRKELRLLRRDVPLLAQVLLRVVYLLPMTFYLLHSTGEGGAPRLALAVGAVAFMCGQVAGSLVWLTVAAEDAPELLGCAPAAAAAIARGKLCAALAPLAALMVVPLTIVVVLAPFAGAVAIVGCTATALCSALIGFRLQKPAKRTAFRRRGAGSLVAGLTEFIVDAAIAAAAGFAVVFPLLIVVPLAAGAAAGWALLAGDGPATPRLSKGAALVH